MPETNYGLVIAEPVATHYMFGGITSVPTDVVLPDGNWRPYLPDPEFQYGKKFDSFSCVTFSALNCIETYAKFKGLNPSLFNRSDRFTAKLSGTVPGIGNDTHTVWESIRKMNGTVDEADWPFQRDTMTVDDYFADVPQPLQDKGIAWLKDWEVVHEGIGSDSSAYEQLLKSSPLQVIIAAYGSGQDANGIYQRSDDRFNHAVMLFNAVHGQYWEIYDHYDQDFKKLSWDFRFGLGERGIIRPKIISPMPINIPSNTLVQLVEATGGFGLYVDGKLYIDDLAKITASWVERNSVNGRFSGGSTAVVLLKDWNAWPHFNLKNEPLS